MKNFLSLLVVCLGGITALCAEAVPGQWGTTDTTKPQQIQWPENWHGEKNLRAQWWKLFCRDPKEFRIENYVKGYDPNNVAYNWRLAEPVPNGTKLLVEGDFPYARMFTFQIGAPWDPEFPYQGRGAYAPEVILMDEDIEPDPGSANPYREGADRYVKNRHYHVTFELVEGKWALNGKAGVPPYRAPGNHRYGGNRSFLDGSSGPSLWVYIHLPDKYDPTGGVEPPVIRIQYPGKQPVLAPITQDIPIQVGRYLKTKPEENPALANGRSKVEQQSMDNLKAEGLASIAASTPGNTLNPVFYRRHTNPDDSLLILKKFGSMRLILAGRSWGNMDYIRGQLPDIMKTKFHQDKSLPPPGNDIHESDHHVPTTWLNSGITLGKDTCLVVTGKAPNTPRTRDGERTMGSSRELRYWMMHWDIGRELPLYPQGSIIDEDVVLDANRNYMIVIAAPEDRPANADEQHGITWHPFYCGPRSTLCWEIVSTANPTWKHAPQMVGWDEGDYTQKTFDKDAVKKRMAEYYPNARYMKKADIEAMGKAGKLPYYLPTRPDYTYRPKAASSVEPRQSQAIASPVPARSLAVRSEAPTVPTSEPLRITSGPITGEERDGVRSFKGIPFAAPPVGELRWKPPQSVAPWIEPRACVKFGPACPQKGKDLYGPVGEQGEDCLNLNVWSPAKSTDAKLPVMFWIHGGGFMFGSGGKACYDGAELAKRGGVVVVSCNYRLGQFGFLAHPALTAESPQHASGNYGMMDQVAALQWVQQNIAAFGGDPGCVTIFGQSAGGVSVCALMASPLAKGLFQRGIVHSGSAPGNLHDRATMESRGVEFAKRLGADDLKAMRAKSADEVLAAAKQGSGRVGEGTQDHLSIDGYVLRESLQKTFAAGRQHNVPLLGGTTKDEDRLFLAGLQAVLKPMAAIQPQTFSYEFRRTPDFAAAKKLGCFHGVELPYLFRYFPPMLKFNADDERLSDLMIGSWSRFARTGDPGWPAFPHVQALDVTTQEAQAPEAKSPPAQPPPSSASAATDQSKSITLRLAPVANSGVTGEITLAPHEGRWSQGMDVTATVHSEKDIRTFRDRHLTVILFSEPDCKFEASLANFYDPSDPKVEHMAVFEEGYWLRTGTWAYLFHPDKLYGLSASSGVRQMGKWLGRDDVPIQEQVKSIGILSYSRNAPEFMMTVLAGVNVLGEPLKVAKVQTEAFEPKEPPEDTTPVTVELLPVGNSGVRGKISLRPYEYQHVGQDNWYRCYGYIKVTGIAGMEESVLAYLSSAPDARWESRECAFFDQWHGKYFLRDGVGMMVNGWFTQRYDMPPGQKGYGGGWHAVRDKMQSVGVYNTKTKTLLAAGNIPPQRREKR